jgi:hypothetical protein
VIKSPWIILMIDRTRLGSAVHAVARPRGKKDPFVDKILRTSRVDRALRYATERKAAFAARKLAKRDHKTLFVAIECGPEDFAWARCDPVREFTPSIQSTLFATEDRP